MSSTYTCTDMPSITITGCLFTYNSTSAALNNTVHLELSVYSQVSELITFFSSKTVLNKPVPTLPEHPTKHNRHSNSSSSEYHNFYLRTACNTEYYNNNNKVHRSV
jgi:hypothetical protein